MNKKLDAAMSPKSLNTPLKREDKGVKDDPQYSPYYPSKKWVVFFDYGHPSCLGSDVFRTKKEAQDAIARGDSGRNLTLGE